MFLPGAAAVGGASYYNFNAVTSANWTAWRAGRALPPDMTLGFFLDIVGTYETDQAAAMVANHGSVHWSVLRNAVRAYIQSRDS